MKKLESKIWRCVDQDFRSGVKGLGFTAQGHLAHKKQHYPLGIPKGPRYGPAVGV